MIVKFRYNKKKYISHKENMFKPLNINDYEKSLLKIEKYALNDPEWLFHVKNVNQRLHLLKETYRVVQSFKRRNKDSIVDDLQSMSEEDDKSGTDVSTPRRGRHPQLG